MCTDAGCHAEAETIMGTTMMHGCYMPAGDAKGLLKML